MDEQAGLRFLPSSTTEGFASKAVSSDNDANPSVIVRELIQNSLDAGTPPGSQVQVDFVFGEMAASEIPGIDDYRSAFEAARTTHAHAPEAAEAPDRAYNGQSCQGPNPHSSGLGQRGRSGYPKNECIAE